MDMYRNAYQSNADVVGVLSYRYNKRLVYLDRIDMARHIFDIFVKKVKDST